MLLAFSLASFILLFFKVLEEIQVSGTWFGINLLLSCGLFIEGVIVTFLLKKVFKSLCYYASIQILMILAIVGLSVFA